jgi:hypothetical protein
MKKFCIIVVLEQTEIINLPAMYMMRPGITKISYSVADPAISGGVDVGDYTTNTGWHLQCTIPPQPGVFGCTKLN